MSTLLMHAYLETSLNIQRKWVPELMFNKLVIIFYQNAFHDDSKFQVISSVLLIYDIVSNPIFLMRGFQLEINGEIFLFCSIIIIYSC